MRFYEVTVKIYEEATAYAYPVVTHVFSGKTRKEAWGYHDAHRKSDSFLRGCEDKGRFGERVKCHAVVTERWKRGSRARRI